MSIHQEEPFDPSRPALVVIVGNTARKYRFLDRDAVALGRAHGCDIGLSAPDVSSLHCLIYRTPAGFCIRDCQSRAGTHINGRAVQEALLRDGDTIQIGPFSFQAYLPPDSAAAAPREATPESRDLPRSRDTFEHRQAELDEQAEWLRQKAREYDLREQRLEEAERALAASRSAWEREAAEREQKHLQAEEDLARRQATLDREVESQWQAWQRHQEEYERWRSQAAPGAAEVDWQEEARKLNIRRRELDHYADSLAARYVAHN